MSWMDEAMKELRPWIGRERIVEDDIGLMAVRRAAGAFDMDPATFKGHIRARYTTGTGATLEFTTQYLPGTRVLELKFAAPLERFSSVTIELQEGILGADKQPLAPWTLSFGTAG